MDHKKLREINALMFQEKAALPYSFSFFLYAQSVEIDSFWFWNDKSATHALVCLSREWVNTGNRMDEFTKDRK